MKVLIAAVAVSLLVGCGTSNKLNSEWKGALAQLQITPVMPLREKLDVGEVYRYLKKPEKFYTDDQIEPLLVFSLENLPTAAREARTWPTFKFEGGSDSSASVVSNAAGILSASLKKDDNLNITITDGFSIRVPSSDIVKEFLDVHTDESEPNNIKTIFIVKAKYQDEIRSLAAMHWHSLGKLFERKVVYLRIPVEVYYANKLNVTAHKTSSTKNSLKIDETKLDKISIEVAANSDSTVSLVETFTPPMAIGYRAIIFEVWPHNMSAREFPEDSGLHFWNGL